MLQESGDRINNGGRQQKPAYADGSSRGGRLLQGPERQARDRAREVPGAGRRRRAGQPRRLPFQLRQASSSSCRAGSGDEALALLKQHDVAVIVTDQRMPRMTGPRAPQGGARGPPRRGRHHPHRVHRRRRADRGDQPRAHLPLHHQAVGRQGGARACSRRPSSASAACARTAACRAARSSTPATCRSEMHGEFDFGAIVGDSPALRDVLARVEQVAQTPSTVLLRGETGTGKEMVARAIHINSARERSRSCASTARRWRPACSSRELFGHEKGAFTGAVARRLGRFELADGGTLFLDEVRRPAGRRAGQAAARAAGARVRARRRRRDRPGRRARGLGDPPRSRAADRRRRVPRGPLLPPQRLSDRAAAAARAARRHPAAGRALHREVRRSRPASSVRGFDPGALAALRAIRGRATCASWRT